MNLRSEDKILPTKLDRIEQRSRKDQSTVFNNLAHVIDVNLLRDVYKGLDGRKALGLDKVSKEDYGKELEVNLDALLKRIKNGTYRPKPSRITEIPKSDGSSRPLAIACFEDKIVQEATRRILEKIFEPLFKPFSFGFRPGRSCHMAVAKLRYDLHNWYCGAVLEIDLKKYFDSIPHKPLMKMLKAKISDRRFLSLIARLLRTPVKESDGSVSVNKTGSPQGSILSPVLANIYLHYVLDDWFEAINMSHLSGRARMVRYADDAVFVTESVPDAERLKRALVGRLGKYGIQINESKTHVMISGPREAEKRLNRGGKMPVFSFLGFLHIWARQRNHKIGKDFVAVRWKTCPKRFKKTVAAFRDYIKHNRHNCYLVPRVKMALDGHLNYFAISFNTRKCRTLNRLVAKMLYRYLNQRSQRRSFNWDQFLNKIWIPNGFDREIKTRNIMPLYRVGL